MSSLIVITPQAAQLRTLLAPALPPDVTPYYLAEPGQLPETALDADIAFGAPDALAALLPRLSRLRWVQSTWAGVTPLVEAGRRDYQLTGVKGLFGPAMSEYVLGWILALQRGVLQHALARQWQRPAERGLGDLTLGIAGTGSIGTVVAERCRPFFRETRGLNRDGRAVAGFDACFAAEQRREFARDLDVLVLLVPQTADTNALADAALLSQLAPGAMVVNAGRANALDTEAALALLERNALSALVLDVLPVEPLPADDRLWQLPGVFITSHTAAPTDAAQVAALFLDNLQRYRSGEPLQGVVDFDRGY